MKSSISSHGSRITHHASRITHPSSLAPHPSPLSFRLGLVCLAAFFLFIGLAPAQTLDPLAPKVPAQGQDELAQAKVLERQAQVAASQAQEETPGEGAVVSGGSGGFGGFGGGGFGGGGTAVLTDRLAGVIQRGAGKTLAIHSSEPDPKDQANLEEDLSVMSHILNKAVEEELGQSSDRVLGINVYFAQGPGSLNNLYLDGYGALFMLNVGFPLLPPPAKAEEEKEKPAVDSAWEEAREELYGGRHEEKPLMGAFPEYNEQNVTKLKDSLLEALKNATNIRNLKADESVTVCIFGGGVGHPRRAAVFRPGGGSSGSAGTKRTEPSYRVWDAQSGKPAGTAPRGSTMTIRVKKSDIDAFAKGKLTLDEFRKRAKIATYASAMTSVSGTSSWFGSSSPFGSYSYGVSRY